MIPFICNPTRRDSSVAPTHHPKANKKIENHISTVSVHRLKV